MRVLVVALVVLLAVSASAETEHSSVSAMVSAALKGAAFKIKKNPAAAQPFHFTAVAGNHEVVLTSESYTDLAGAQNGVESVIAHAGLRQNIQPSQAKDGKPYFTVKADNNKVIGVSETYSSAAAAQKGADALHAIVKDVTNSIAQSIPVTKGKSESSKKAASSSSKTTSKKHRFGSKTGSGIAPSEAAKKQESGKSKKSVKAGYFQIIQTPAGFHYVIKGANGETVAQSEVYPTKQNVQAGVGAALRACGVKENLNVEKSESAGKGFFVNCKAENNQKLFNTEIYTRAATGEDAVTVLQNAVRATIGRYVKVLPVSITKSESGSKAESSGARRLESSVKKVIGK